MISSLDLAKKCGVSQGTVDRALHDRPGISPKTKEKILKMAKELGYMANPAALEIMGKRSSMVGVLTPALNSAMLMEMVQVLQDVVSTKGYRLFTSFFRSDEDMLDGIREFAARKAAGVVVFPVSANPVIPENLPKAIKVINLMEPMKNKDTYFVSPDNYRIGKLCTEKLFEYGHKKILMLDLDLDRLTVRVRSRGFSETMLAAGLEPYYLLDSQIEQLPELIKSGGITAIYAHAGELAFECRKFLAQVGINCPDDISILSGQDHPVLHNYFSEFADFIYPVNDIAKGVLAILEDQPIPTISNPVFHYGTTLRKLGN